MHRTTAEEYAKIAEQRNPKIHVQFVAKGYIDQIKPQLDAKWEDVLAVPKTHKMHCTISKGKGMVMVSDTSDSKEYTIVPLRKPDSLDSEEEAVAPLDKLQEPLEGSEELFIESEEHTITTVDLCVGQWVIVNYDGEGFPGEITCCDGNDQFEVSVMHKSGNHWKWPKTIDKILYARDDIVQILYYVNMPNLYIKVTFGW